MAHKFFREAAFLGVDGKVYCTGAFHDLNGVPDNIDVADEGFVDHAGKFYNREQASVIVNAPAPIQSEQMFDQDKSQAEIDKIKEASKANRQQ